MLLAFRVSGFDSHTRTRQARLHDDRLQKTLRKLDPRGVKAGEIPNVGVGLWPLGLGCSHQGDILVDLKHKCPLNCFRPVEPVLYRIPKHKVEAVEAQRTDRFTSTQANQYQTVSTLPSQTVTSMRALAQTESYKLPRDVGSCYYIVAT